MPLLFNFPHTGKILSLAFVPFAAWFSNVDLSLGQWFSLATAGSLSMFGSINAAMPFLLDLVRLPADLFDLFTMSGVLNSRFGSLVATMHTAALSMLVAASLLGVLRVSARRLIRLGVIGVMILALFIGGTRLMFERVVPPATAGFESLAGFHLREGAPAPVLIDPVTLPEPPGAVADRLDLILRRGVVRVGFFTDAVPYAFFNTSKELVGFDVEMAFQLATALGVTPAFVPIERGALTAALESGLCDIVMSGVVVTVSTAAEVDFSQGYHRERVGFLVPDHDRGLFARIADVRGRPLRLGVLSSRFVVPVSRLLPQATVVPTELADVLRTGEMTGLDAYVIPIDQARYVQPRATRTVRRAARRRQHRGGGGVCGPARRGVTAEPGEQLGGSGAGGRHLCRRARLLGARPRADTAGGAVEHRARRAGVVVRRNRQTADEKAEGRRQTADGRRQPD